jgi:outer membrane protein OmpA-like peptidoglycan-associated protein
MTVKPFGEARPRATNMYATGRALNRRVEVTLQS